MKTQKKQRLFERLREDFCPYCGMDRSLELYDSNNRPINFSLLLDRHLASRILDRREVYYGRCKSCNKQFELDWSRSNKIPVPLSDSKFQNYIKQYSKSKVV